VIIDETGANRVGKRFIDLTKRLSSGTAM
jgi:hypothetical protein